MITGRVGRAAKGVALIMGDNGITNCLFRNISHLVQAVMLNPPKAVCFTKRQWTVVLMGNSSWAATAVSTAVTLGLYDQVSKGLRFFM